MDKKKIIITGANGQLGQYLIKYLQELDEDLYIVGTVRHKSFSDQIYIYDKSSVQIELMDLSDSNSIEELITKYNPDYFVNTAANAFVGESWTVPIQQININTLGVLYQLEAIRKYSSHTRYLNLGTSEEFGVVGESDAQDESTIINPKSPYGVAKAAARYLVRVYRDSYNLYAVQPWVFNFESKLRGEKYLTRKVTKGVSRISHAIENNKDFDPIELGNLNSYRSWQHASDVADAIWRMLNQQKFTSLQFDKKCNTNSNFICGIIHSADFKPKEYVISSGDTHQIRTFVEESFKLIDLYGKWYGYDLQEKFVNNYDINLVTVNEKYFRPNDVTYLFGDSSAIRNDLGWSPKYDFTKLVKEMVDADIKDYE